MRLQIEQKDNSIHVTRDGGDLALSELVANLIVVDSETRGILILAVCACANYLNIDLSKMQAEVKKEKNVR